MAEPTDSEGRVERLRNAAAEFARFDGEAEIFEHAVDVARELVPADTCVVLQADDGALRPVAARDTVLTPRATPLRVDEGVAGQTLGGDAAIRIDDVRDTPEARPRRQGLRSALSVPVDDDVVLQICSETVGAYDETDVELAELLADHTEHAVDRVRYEAAVERERDRFAALFQNVPDAAVQYRLVDGRPEMQRVNSAFVRVFGHDPSEAIGETAAALLVPESERERAADLYDDVAAGERLDVEVTRSTVDGTRPFLLRSVPVWTERGDVSERVGYFIYTDISELREREAALERKNERLDAFTSIVSHDLRNPLSVAQGYLEETRRSDTDHLDTIGAELDRMERMIEDLLTLAQQGAIAGEMEPVDLGRVAEDAWSHVRTEGSRLVVADSRTVEADPERVTELLENLFRNSVEHGSTSSRTESDAASVTVTVGTTDCGGFYVADDGRGIPTTRREEVFEMGVSTSADGTGFGLGIVEEIAEAHGWAVDVTASESGGARFEIDVDGGDR